MEFLTKTLCPPENKLAQSKFFHHFNFPLRIFINPACYPFQVIQLEDIKKDNYVGLLGFFIESFRWKIWQI